MLAASAHKNFLAALLTVAFMPSLLFAGSGTIVVTAVSDLGGSTYELTTTGTASLTLNDHLGCALADGSGAVYLVSTIGGGTVQVTDTLTEDEGGAHGVPPTGTFWYATPTAEGYSKPPYSAPGWDAPLRRNAEILGSISSQDSTAVTITGGTITATVTGGTLAGSITSSATVTGGTLSAPTISGATLSGNTTNSGSVSGGTLSAVTISSGTIDAAVSLSGTGKVLQFVSTGTTSLVSCTTLMQIDDTVPTKTEGDEVITLSITPTNASSTLVIEFVGGYDCNTTFGAAVSLFKDADASAIAAMLIDTPSENSTVVLKHVVAAGSTSARTYKIRGGPGTSGQLYFNGAGGSRYFGGTYAGVVLTITEIGP